jgi:hypothetical protein
MKTMNSISSWAILALAASCFLMTGCISRRIVWSPDGAHAVVFAGDGLRLGGPDGALSEIVLPGNGLADWFPDSRRVALVSELGKQSWNDIQKFIPPEERQRVEQGARTLSDELKAGKDPGDALKSLNNLGDYEKNAAAVYLAQLEGTRELAGTNWDALRQIEASVLQIRVGAVQEGKLVLGPPLVSTLRRIQDLRVSPTGAAFALTAEGDKKDELDLLVMPGDGSTPPQLVASNTAYCSDWSVDGRSLVYVRAMNGAGTDDQISLAALSRRAVLDAANKINIRTNADDLAGLLFDANNKVRCLADGRILFAAADVHLPCTTLDMPQQPQLFALDPEREAEVIPLIPRSVQDSLPAKSGYYESSPDGKQIAISGEKGAVAVLTLATGAFITVQAAGSDDTIAVPSWRSAGELCYVRVTNGQPAQVALWSQGTNRVLSANWPAEARKGFLDK